jgi:pimeloyl-ACP methyl ester carboxylesterase
MEPYPTWTEEWDKIGGDVSKSSKPWVIPGAKYVLLPAGHNSHWERPNEISQMVVDFLK